MKRRPPFFLAWCLAAGLSGFSTGQAAGSHELILCAAVNRDYVIGSKLVTENGLFRRTASGQFEHFGLNFPHLFNISVDPRDRNVLVMATLNGAIVSRDGGRTLRIATSWDMTEAKDVTRDPMVPDTLYLALPDGVAVSVDGGATWTRRENGLPERGKYTQSIQVDRTRSGRVFAACESGIYLTEDSARRWRRVLPTKATVGDVQQSPHDPAVWIAVTHEDGAWISRNRGLDWKPLAGIPNDRSVYNLAFDATRAGRIAISSWTDGVWTSDDAGQTWQTRNDGLPASPRVISVGIDPDSGRLYASIYREDLYQSDDFGRTWRAAGLAGSVVHSFNFVAGGAP